MYNYHNTMQIIIDNQEQNIFFTKLKNLPKKVKMEGWGNKRVREYRRIEYITFCGKEIGENELTDYIIVLENRYRLAFYCLGEMRKECETIIDNETKINELKNKAESNVVNPEFLIKAEYFVYSLNSALDAISYFIKHVYNLKINNHSIGKVYHGNKSKRDGIKYKRDNFSRYFLKEWKGWIQLFRSIRNRMMHHQIIRVSTHLSQQLQTKQVEYTKYCISIIDENGEEILKPPPNYFEEIIKDYNGFKDEFYKKLNSII